MADLKQALVDLGIEASLVDQIVSKVGDKKLHVLEDGQFVPKTRFDEVNEQKNTYKKQTDELNGQVAELSKFKGTADELQQKVASIQQEYTTKMQEAETNFHKKLLDREIDTALTLSKAKNTKAVKALLDTSAIKLDGDKVVGLNEQLETVIKDNPYLFDTQQQTPPPNNVGRTNTPPANTGNPKEDALRKSFGLPDPK